MSAAQTPPSSSPIEPPRYRGRTFLRSCLGIAIAVVVLAVVAIGSCVVWIRQPGELIETGSLLDRETALYAELYLRPDDPGILKFFEEVIEEQQQLQREMGQTNEVPPFLRPLFGNLPQRKPGPSDLEKTLPLIVVATRQSSDFEDPSPFFFTISLPKMGNRLRFADMMGAFFVGFAGPDDELQVIEYGDEAIYVLDDNRGRQFYVALKGSDVLLGQQEEQMKATIDRLNAPVEDPDPSMKTLMTRHPEEAALFVAARSDLAESTVDMIANAMPGFDEAIRPLAGGSGGLVLWARILSTDLVEGELRILKGPGETEEPRDDWEGTVTRETDKGSVTLKLTRIEPAADERHAWKIEVHGVALAARETIRELDDEGRRDRREPETDPNNP